jgi:hypothetical protein
VILRSSYLLHNFVHEWEDRERERIPHPITPQTHALFRDVGLLKYYEEATSLKGNSSFLQQLIHCWDHGMQTFRVDLDLLY